MTSTTPGTETFTDLFVYTNPGWAQLQFHCLLSGRRSQYVRYNLDYVTADGVHHSASEEYGSDGAFSTFMAPSDPVQLL